MRSGLLAGIATVHDLAGTAGWVRVQLQAERLDRVPEVLAGLDLPFMVEQPEALRGLLRRLAGRLVDGAENVQHVAPQSDRSATCPMAFAVWMPGQSGNNSS